MYIYLPTYLLNAYLFINYLFTYKLRPHGTQPRLGDTWHYLHLHIGLNMTCGTQVKPMSCHVAPSLGYDMPHGIYAKPCHVASMQGIKHATYARPKLCHVAHRLGLRHPTCHRTCHMAHMFGLNRAMWHIGQV